ncbi:MAG: DUF4105 domain-containing protein [Bacteroidales bacterium]|jgi:hypothetical protein|nr:DUF4105 domain-containing protein [Bacteroidales bacterium]
MKRFIIILTALFLLSGQSYSREIADSAEVYLITCAPGNESYSIYGHTALRVVIREHNIDVVYNWGIFDFSTPNFVLRFAKGRLDYMLGAYSYDRFVNEYRSEERAVWSQKINLTAAEKERLFVLINENLKPENIKYRYDFFFDNCATRVRDILVASATDTIIFPEKERKDRASFRQLIDPHQKVLPWLDFGADMLLGLQADRKATTADEMFLPIFLKENMSSSQIVHDGVTEPLLEEAVIVADFPGISMKGIRVWIPQFVLYAVLLFVLLVTFVLGIPFLVRFLDIILFIIYSVIAILLIFTNFWSEHDALHFNLVLLGINPILPVLLFYILVQRKAVALNRIALTVSLLWIPASLIAGQGINPALIPLVLIIMVRIFRHCEFGKTL